MSLRKELIKVLGAASLRDFKDDVEIRASLDLLKMLEANEEPVKDRKKRVPATKEIVAGPIGNVGHVGPSTNATIKEKKTKPAPSKEKAPVHYSAKEEVPELTGKNISDGPAEDDTFM